MSVSLRTVNSSTLIFIHYIYIFLYFFRYGSCLKLLQEDAVDDLTLLMKHVKVFLSTQRVGTTSQLSILLYFLHLHWMYRRWKLAVKGSHERPCDLSPTWIKHVLTLWDPNHVKGNSGQLFKFPDSMITWLNLYIDVAFKIIWWHSEWLCWFETPPFL